MRRTLLFFVVVCVVSTLQAQRLNHVQGELIVQFYSHETTPQEITRTFQNSRTRQATLDIKRSLNTSLNIWLFTYDYARVNGYELLEKVRSNTAVQYAQFNHLLKRRNNPNDPQFVEQWNYVNLGMEEGIADADIDMEEAWDITTGGLTATGDTIVIAILDDGVDMDHDDLAGNLWKNHAEIPNNGIDDDNNGFTDDFNGWNFILKTDQIDHSYISRNRSHGSEVASMIGAVGNNGIGIAGVNWNIKLMILGPFGTGSETDNEAVAIEAYSYVLDARTKYNASNGQQGAYVVATNSSWGVEGRAEDAPIWCSFFDVLGEQGIINTVATYNEHLNVEEVGDLPTTCPSDFLIGVTNSTNRDQKVPQAGYGTTSIDLAAPAEKIPLLFDGNEVSFNSGTSYAAPTVAGVIGLIYAAPCADLSGLSKQAPNEAALQARQYLLNGVDKRDSLKAYTVTGGRLNAHNSLRLIMADCGSCPAILEASIQTRNQFEASIDWSNEDNQLAVIRYRKSNEENWIVLSDKTSPFILDNLEDCTDYEVQLATKCDANNLQFGRSYNLKTIGCCEAPRNISTLQQTDNSITIAWDSVLTASNYEVVLSNEGMDNIQTLNSDRNILETPTLSPCTDYEVSVRPICGTKVTLASETYAIKTKGCGACLDLEYCSANAMDASFEWIESFTINDLSNTSGLDNGFGDHTATTTSLSIGKAYPFQLQFGYPDGESFEEYVKIWIDYNQDGVFDEVSEVAYNSEVALVNEVVDSISIPFDAISGNTRLRIAMKSIEDPSLTTPIPCEEFEFGEVEDYCIEILDPNLISSTNDFYQLIPTIEIFPNPSREKQQLKIQVIEPTELEIELLTIEGKSLSTSFVISLSKGEHLVPLPISNLSPGIYLVALKSEYGRIVKRILRF